MSDLPEGWLLPRNFLLRSLPASEWETLRGQLRSVQLTRTHFHLLAGERLEHVYFPNSGLVSLMVDMADGATAEVAVVGAEGMLGLSVALESDPPPFDMLCQISGQALCLEAHAFKDCFEQLHALRSAVLRYSFALLSHMTRSAACNALHPVEQRLARWLLLCRDRVGSNTFPLTHETLAHMLAVGRPFLTQTMGVLHKAGLIEYRHASVHIVDGAGLEAAACEDYRATEDHYAHLFGGRPWGDLPARNGLLKA